MSAASRQQGFSMVELMTVLAVAAVMLGIGVPGFRHLLESQAITATANEFFAALNLARAEAIKRGHRVDLVPADGGRDWARGWMVFVDENHNRMADADEQVIFARGPVSGGIAIRASFTDSKVQYIAYSGSGRTRTNASAQQAQVGNLTFRSASQTRKVSLNFLGRPRVCNPGTDKSC